MAERHATGTPIRELFAESDKATAERITELENEVKRIYLMLGISAQTQITQGQHIAKLEIEARKRLDQPAPAPGRLSRLLNRLGIIEPIDGVLP